MKKDLYEKLSSKDKAIEDDCWEKNPNEVLLGYEYIAIKKMKYININYVYTYEKAENII